MSREKKGNNHKHGGLRELRKMSDVQLVDEVASEDEAVRVQSEAELQRRLSERVARLNRTLLLMTGVLVLMDGILIALAYRWMKPRMAATEAWRRAGGMVDLQLARRRAGDVVEGAGQAFESAREAAGHGIQAATSSLEAAGHGLVGAERIAGRRLQTAGHGLETAGRRLAGKC